MFAVLGASGNTGRVVAETLLSQNKKVRVVVRDVAKGQVWTAAGADVSVADVEDGAALTRALARRNFGGRSAATFFRALLWAEFDHV